MRKEHVCIKIVTAILLVGCLVVFYFTAEKESGPQTSGSPQIFAHRGASDRFNESTITAYEIAAAEGVDALEIDLRMTEDGTLVAMHDETIDRTTNGTGEVVEYTLDQLKSIPTVAVFDGEMTMEEIPTLEEILQRFEKEEAYYLETRLVEGKTLMEEPLLQLLKKHDLVKREAVMIQSFSEESLEKVRELAPELSLTLLFRKGEFDLEKALAADFPVIGMESSDATMKNVKALQRQGKQVQVFFNDRNKQKQEQKRMKRLQVDGYFTDYIGFTKELLSR
ncbi:MAG: glycerophosphodiester phosphodiesterase [Bacillus sp. (in: firmicutes)]